MASSEDRNKIITVTPFWPSVIYQSENPIVHNTRVPGENNSVQSDNVDPSPLVNEKSHFNYKIIL